MRPAASARIPEHNRPWPHATGLKVRSRQGDVPARLVSPGSREWRGSHLACLPNRAIIAFSTKGKRMPFAPSDVADERLIWIDLEMTGLD